MAESEGLLTIQSVHGRRFVNGGKSIAANSSRSHDNDSIMDVVCPGYIQNMHAI